MRPRLKPGMHIDPWGPRPPAIRPPARAGTPRASGPVSVVAALLLSAWFNGADAAAGEWHFDVSVDGFPVGTHDISIQQNGEERSTRSDMHFRVSLLGLKAGSYEQHEEESWRGDCLTRLDSRTVEKGKTTTVAGRLDGNGFSIDGAGAEQRLPACVMSFAYWNPRVLKQTKLVNVQTGAWTPINVSSPSKETYTVRGASVDATHYRIDTARNKIDVWYSSEGEWIGLRSTSREGHVLAYRLK